MKNILLLALVVIASFCMVSAVPQICADQSECPRDEYCNGGYCTYCQSNNDCKLNEYCSTNTLNLDEFGTCMKFHPYGDDCIGLSDGNIELVDASNATKCATFYYNPDTDSLVIDARGFCASGKCRQCDYTNNAPGSALVAEGKGPQRVCVFPGRYETVHTAPWSGGAYYENPTNVWLAIFFCLIVIIVVLHAMGSMKK
ncbi:hypothetical protein DLAC_09893 [Tieghemostelium lacteum]|uniref:Uncharacterized protein n=1 Tax=Tieghemostelium lacteum TaxID=361077 RepID=A0A151Z5M2_TIELA|nr:hypothetical protein DLAC_09893 [Tieghemostelium lacteum]|eukprot:KYQ89238.1 hypothetical protein DLAC_09893 [Tieghemostelium lacteum]